MVATLHGRGKADPSQPRSPPCAAGSSGTSGCPDGWASTGPRLRSLLVADLVEAARPRFRALTRTTEAANAYSLVARLLDSAVHTLKAQDLTPEGVRRDPAAAAKMVLTASWFLDSAASALAEAGARLGLPDPDWTSFIALAES
ncbi:hypothetical protein G3I59_05055 [Amycolatopsis rubida]|uniref:Uncharacterized protein n=1 Tax=Amycolatopsis rubida TaxID=112413 RepID=A0ABX0BHW9_9PSEU|nr:MULTISPECIES: hypothetical protein [Amycolatopsis]MYW90002.1 hypothetical protein [Amycolatopsis rubida]NEC54979.1 hypothetical protein [Amycolatopsis rubida]OAP29163.1 hypothetical protein A4R44_00958 [Amycolatopsis sp. M39]